MIPAARRPWFVRWMGAYTDGLLRQQFAGIVLLGDAGALPTKDSTIVLLNHISWWDGLLLMWLQRHCWQRPTFAWMELQHLRRLAFFRWLGGIGLGPGAREMRQALRYVGSLLAVPGNVLAIFPQGQECLDSARPWQFARGPAWLIERLPAVQVKLVCLRYVFLSEPKPWIGIYCDPQLLTGAAVAEQEERMEQGYQMLATYFQENRYPGSDVKDNGQQAVRIIRFAKEPGLNWPTRMLAWLTWWWDGKVL